MAKKAKYPNIVRGGIAIPIPNKTNYYYMKGKKHKDGGIDIGKNPHTGLEVEDGEILHLTDNNIKVYSSVPFLNGKSPAEKVMNGENPNKVFKQQEDFKDKNHINDDGTRKAEYGKKAAVVRTPEDEKVNKLTRSYYKEVNPLSPFPGIVDAIKHGTNVLLQMNNKPDSTAYRVTDKVADATWRKRLGLSYNEADLPSNPDGTVRLPKDRELEIPVDTNLLKRRINANRKLSNKYEDSGRTRLKKVVDWAIGEDEAALNALRKTYKTGQPVVVNEQAYNSRSLIKNGEISMPGSSPLNSLQNYTLKYDKDRNVMIYKDVYDFNYLDWAVPGKGYKIQGEIDLNKKQMGGKINKPVTVTVNGKTKVVYSPTGNTRSGAEGFRRKAFLGDDRKLIEDYHTRRHNEENDNQYIPSLYHNITIPITSNKISRKSKYYDPKSLPKVMHNVKTDKVIVQNSNKPVLKQNTSEKDKVPFFKKVGNWIKNNKNDIISLGANTIGGITSYLINNNMLNKMKYKDAPISRYATKLKTTINTSAREAKLRETAKLYNDWVTNNTSSSKVAFARKNRINTQLLSQYNSLIEDKINKETELINKDRLNRQDVINKSIADYNAHLQEKAKFENAILDKKSENAVSLVNTINSGIQDVIKNNEQKRKDRNSLIAIIAANPNVNPQILKDLGFDGITQEEIDLIKKSRG